MSPLTSIAAASLLFLGSCQAHFLLKTPTPVGAFDEDTESSAPCGGLTPSFSTDNITNFAVGGDAISTQSGHPQVSWLYRVSFDETASGNWTQIYPIVQQSGLNTYCAPSVTVPESWVGKTAVLSVVGDAPDGLLYQCAAVKFVSGVNSNLPSTCVNSTGVTGSFVSDSALTALVGNSTSSSNSTGTATGSSSTTSSTKNAAPAMYGGSVEGLRSLITVGAMVAVGAALMI